MRIGSGQESWGGRRLNVHRCIAPPCFWRAILKDRGAFVTAAGSAEEGRQRVASDRPRIIICDIGMPSEDGYDFIAGSGNHLAKPVEPTEQLVTVASLAGRYTSTG